MNFSMVLHLMGWILTCEGALLLLPLITAIIYGESTLWIFLITMVCCLVVGVPFVFRKPGNRVFHLKDGFIITGLGWVVMTLFGALPFFLSDAIPNPIDALFETVSGFTTTGASILTNVEILPKSLLFWRSFTHWVGGMGVLVFLLTLLPLTGGSGSHMNLMKAESPGPQVEKLVPKVQSTAKILYGIYIGLTLIEIIFLLAGGMPLFDTLTTTFGTVGTGGFGVRNDSIAGYSTYIQVVVTVFMILSGVNFNFYFLFLMRKFRKAVFSEEVRWYFGIVLTAGLLITFNISDAYGNFGLALKDAFFQVGSIITTTGFATADFNLWPEFSKAILVLLMFIGACAGSTGGGIKVSRIVIIIKSIGKELHHFIHPHSIRKLSIDGKSIQHEVVRSVNVFMMAYLLIYAASVLLISIDNFDFTTNFTAVAAALNNIGPGLGGVAPVENFSKYSDFSKLVLIFDMLAGRLEIFPLLLLFRKETWERF